MKTIAILTTVIFTVLLNTSITAKTVSDPTLPGEYQVGYREVTLVDTSRVDGADYAGRVLKIAIWYPIDDAVAATGIKASYDSDTEGLLLYGIPVPFLIFSSEINAMVDSSSIIAPTMSNPNDPACDDPFSLACAVNSIVGLPVSNDGPFPVVLWSHGFGTSTYGYARYTEHLASHGYIVVAPLHSGSSFPDLSIGFLTGLTCSDTFLRPCLDLGTTPTLNRPQDLSFALDKLLDGSLGIDLQQAANPDKIAAAGHSMGGYTALMMAGGLATAVNGFVPGDLKDSRIKAVYAMSPASGTTPLDGAGVNGSIIYPDVDLANIDVPTVINYAQFESNVLGLNITQNSQQFFSATDSQLSGNKYLIEMLSAGHNHFLDICRNENIDVFKFGNDNPSGINALFEALQFTIDLSSPTSPNVLVGKVITSQQANCENDYFYDPINFLILSAITLPPPAPAIPLSALLFNEPPLSIPQSFLPGFIDPTTYNFISTRTSKAVMNDVKGYLLSFLNVYLRNEPQNERFIKGTPGVTNVVECYKVGSQEQCKQRVFDEQ